MAKSKVNNRLAEMEAQKRAAERQEKTNKTWQQVAFIAVSVIVLLSMILALFIHP